MTANAFTAPAGAAHERLDVYLAAVTGQPRSQAARLVRSGLVSVNGRPGRASYLMQTGDQVEVRPEPASAAGALVAPELTVVYEDDDLLVVDKPAGITVHPGAGRATLPAATVADFARARTTDTEDPQRPGIVHRLDRDTSGLLVIAKNPAAKAYLQAAFKGRRVHKTYQLLVVGHTPHEAAVINLPLGRNPAHPLRSAVVADGRDASTSYRTSRRYRGYSLLEARPLTGRTHQLRVHFAALGHPVAGDTTYGPPRRPLGLRRQFLHAAALEFTAPSGRQLKLACPLPADLRQALRRLEAGES